MVSEETDLVRSESGQAIGRDQICPCSKKGDVLYHIPLLQDTNLIPSIILLTSGRFPLLGFSMSWMSVCLQAKVGMTVMAPLHPLVAENLDAFGLKIL